MCIDVYPPKLVQYLLLPSKQAPCRPFGATMPKYVLTYFNFRARAELARLLFAEHGTEYEDERITAMEQWNRTKPGK